jgi:hypothetical protein
MGKENCPKFKEIFLDSADDEEEREFLSKL